MSFITKRERVFNEYHLLDLPARNEGKLKAYASCTDARAWSHFCADKSDHLVEIIKRNNETCRPKYVPTDVIVNTLMGTKNAEIARLRRKIEEFEQLLAAYDQLDLTCDQKVEIASAHAAIKAANKELDDMCLDLDLSGYTEGIDSEAFETGKSRGDEISRQKDFELETSRGTEWSFDKLSISNKENKGNQIGGLLCPCDASTGAVDPRIDEMQETIITKDAKLSAMRNTIAVLENDVCEPYCIYAHIYTALEKIYGILCQNEKYKCYLELLTSGKDTKNVDIKGKIFYKLKVFEKFCCALIAPCSNDCSCYHAEIISRVETAFALSTDESVKINIDTKRAHLVADIMGNEEMKELLNKRNSCSKIEDSVEDEFYGHNNSCLDVENIYRLKDLQASYDDLLTCYDDLKFEKYCLTNKCRKYEELEKQVESLRNQLNSCGSLWNEKEYYKKRSEDLDLLKEKYLVLADETLHLETQLKAQEEINNVKSVTLEQLRSENSILEKKLNEVSSVCEREKHALVCKLKECECKMICQDEQIKSLSLQLNKFLENNNKDVSDEKRSDSGPLLDEIELQKEEIKNLKNALFYNEKEKQQLEIGYEEKLKIINNLRLEIEEWKSICENQTQRNKDLEKLTEETQDELNKITKENKNLVREVEIKNVAIKNLMNVVSNKSLEINKLANEIELQTKENRQLQEINELCNAKISTLENERKEALISLDLASKESNTLLESIFKYDNFSDKQNMNCDEYKMDKPIEYGKISGKENRSTQQLENQSKINLDPMNEIDTFQVKNIKKMDTESDVSTKYLEMKEKDINYEETMNSNYLEKEIDTDETKISVKKIMVKQELQKQSRASSGPLNESDTFLLNDTENFKNMLSENKSNYLEMKDCDLYDEKVMKSKSYKFAKVTEYATTSDEKYKVIQQLQSQSKINSDLLNEIDTFRMDNTKNIKKILSESSMKYLEMKGTNNEILEIKSQELDELKEKLMIAEESYKHLLLENNNLMKQLEEKTDRIDEAYRKIQELEEENNQCLSQINDNESVKEYLSQLQRENKTMFERKNNLENDVLLKNEEIKFLTDLVNKLKVGKQQFDLICITLETLEQKYKELSTAYDGLIIEKNNVLQEIKLQKDELRSTLDSLRIKTNENNKLINDFRVSQEQYLSAQNKIHSLERNLNDMKAENIFLKEKLECHSNLEKELDVIKKSYHHLKIEKEKLEQDLKLHLNILEEMKIENEKLHDESNHLVEYNKDIENALIGARHEIQTQLNLPSNSYMNLKKEVEQLKKEKDSNLKQIKQITDKLCESEELITNLTQEISERDVKISILENHVNNLSNEVRRLQGSLGSMIDLGEEMNVRNQEIDQSLKQIEAHHSKANHNMKIELAKLINANVKLEDQLSATNVEIKTLTEKNDTRSSQEIRLQDERDKIVTSIEKLEIRCVGNSTLSQNNASINIILQSLENIGNHVEASNNSCQLILNKADEAKKIIEKEKQKVMKEKDDALKDKMDIQKQLSILKERLEEQRSNDESVIKDLETELLNQKILIDEISQSNQSYVLKLEVELRSIQSLYQNALDKIRDLEAKSKIADERCDRGNNIIKKAKIELEDKCKEIKSLQNIINTLQTKQVVGFATQTNFQNNLTSVALQTDNLNLHTNADDSWDESDKTLKNVYKNKDSEVLLNIPLDDTKELKPSKIPSDFILKMPFSKLNKVQVLAENDQPSITFIKNAYISYKIKRLSFRQTEQYSFSIITNEVISDPELVSVNKQISPNILNNFNWSKTEISRKDSFYKMNIVSNISNMQFSNSYANSIYSSEIDRNFSFPEPTDISYKIKNDKKFADRSGQKDSKSTINLNVPEENTVSKSKIDSRGIHKTKSSDEPKMLQNRNLNFNNISLSEVISSKFTLPLYNKEDIQQNAPNSTGYDNRNLLNFSDYLLKGSLSDTSLLKNGLHNDLMTNNKEQINEGITINLMKPLKSNSLKSLNSPTEFKEGDDIKDLKYFDSKNRIKHRDNFQHKDFLIDNTVYNVLSARNPETRIGNKSNINDKNNTSSLNHGSITNFTKHNSITNSIENFNGKQRSIENLDQLNISSDTSSLHKHSRNSNIFSKKSKSVPNIHGAQVYNRINTKNIGVMAQIDNIDTYQKKIKFLTSAIENMDRDYKEKISAIKAQYDNNIRNIMNEHNQGVQSLQSLHEETLQDILKVHENETDNLRSMSIEAMRKVDKLESENKILRSKILTSNSGSFYEAPTRISSNEIKKRGAKYKAHNDIKTLTKTDVEEFNINPKTYGPCTCSLDINISDTIRNIFEQVDVDQRKLDEQAYIKHIANKILTSSIEGLDIQELSFLHFKVCRSWKTMLRKGEVLHKRIDSLESELINKQKQAQIHIAELDRKVAEERRRLQEVREAVCRDSPPDFRPNISQPTKTQATAVFEKTLHQDLKLTHNHVTTRKFEVAGQTPGGDLAPGASFTELCCRRTTTGRERRIVMPKLDGEDRRDRKQYCDERPIRLRRSSDRPHARSHKK